MNELVSIIVPVYNVEKYIEKCVDSIIDQDYRPIEIILVDDGSTDQSGNICDRYKLNHNIIKVIHKNNGGLSDARNAGIDIALGEYICCIDSDDYIEEGFISYLMDLIHKYNAEMSICNISYVDQEVITNPIKSKKEFVSNSSEILERILDEIDVTESACAKMYKRELFKNVRYPVGRTEEDLATTYKLVGKCNKIAFGNSKSYFYVNRGDSITKREFSEANFNIIWAFNNMKEYIMAYYPELVESCNKRECSIYMRLLQKAVISNVNDKRIKEVRKKLQKKSIQCFGNSKARVSEKTRYILVAYFPKLYLIGYSVLKRIKIDMLKR